ncbi:EcsC family protein [Streptomyces ossamyceticus]|nr:EcsC family protein [Streptomyces ossamyceticus]
MALALATRTVTSIALRYSYHPSDSEEELLVMTVMALGMATGTSAKTATYAELSRLTQPVLRSALRVKLNGKGLTKIAKALAVKFTQWLAKMKVRQFAPITDPAVGPGPNYMFIDRIAASPHRRIAASPHRRVTRIANAS